jgi:hypothetical protein
VVGASAREAAVRGAILNVVRIDATERIVGANAVVIAIRGPQVKEVGVGCIRRACEWGNSQVKYVG